MNPLRYLLLPLAWLFATGSGFRKLLYKTGIFKVYQPPMKVISVGNLRAGGTGKTPMVEYLLRQFRQKGIQVASLSRGYGRKTRGFLLVDPSKGGAETFGDEPLQLAMGFPEIPVAVCEKRAEGAALLHQQFAPEVLVLDDAFQHLAIHRDLDIVLLDANFPPHEDLLLPAGLLREPMSALRRASLVIFTKISSEKQMESLRKKYAEWQPCFTTLRPLRLVSFDGRQQLEPGALAGKTVVGFCGIGNPEFFTQQVKEINPAAVVTTFGDHHTYSESEISALLNSRLADIESGKTWVVTTSKDFARLRRETWLFGGSGKFNLSSFFYIETGVHWLEGEERLHVLIASHLKNYA